MESSLLPAGSKVDEVQWLAAPESDDEPVLAAEDAGPRAWYEVSSVIMFQIIQTDGLSRCAVVPMVLHLPIAFHNILLNAMECKFTLAIVVIESSQVTPRKALMALPSSALQKAPQLENLIVSMYSDDTVSCSVALHSTRARSAGKILTIVIQRNTEERHDGYLNHFRLLVYYLHG